MEMLGKVVELAKSKHYMGMEKLSALQWLFKIQ
jgi:hypothetical protein